MYSLDELKKQNEDISELCDVLSVLIEARSLHDNSYVCELMSRFREKVWMHLVFEDNTVYAELARHQDPSISETALNFHNSAKEIRKSFSRYVKHWCKPSISDSEHEARRQDSEALFRMIRERIDYENQHMFPLIQEH